MKLSEQTITKLREIINGGEFGNISAPYRSAPKLIEFFREFGFNDVYGPGFPSRWAYTEEKLNAINDTADMDRCIKKVFAPNNFIGDFPLLQKLLADFNKYLSYDGWKVCVEGREVFFQKAKFELKDAETAGDEEQFLRQAIEFDKAKIKDIPLENLVLTILEQRMDEIEKCLKHEIPLACIFLCGSVLEGIFIGIAQKNPAKFNAAKSSPKNKEGKVKNFPDWTLANYIDAASELGIIDLNVKKFSSAMRDFRNYIHPYQQMLEKFAPDIETAKLCVQVLKIAILNIARTNK